MRFSEHKKELQVVGGSLVLGALAVLSFFFVQGIIRTQLTTIGETLQQVALVSGRVDRLSQLTELVRVISQDRSTLESFFLTEDELVGFLELTETFAQRTNTTFEFSSIDPAALRIEAGTHSEIPVDSENSHPTYQLALSIEGSWENVQKAVQLVESAPIVMIIHSVSFVVDDDLSESLWRADIRMSVGRTL